MEFDEFKAVEAINNRLKDAGRAQYESDEVLNIIDMIWDFYEENGLLDIESDPDDDPDDIEQDVVDYVKRMLKKDKNACVDEADVELMVKAEMEYEDTII
ncbi:MAG: hypothetical protein HDS68_04360 [Bacteroidales bacterium]|nr:hypothetical protein [Bacteroidales bacterium]